ncbi:MAG: SDR family NAD(P)-dependent oxidoreductase [Phycisphaerae bacterium]|nr:SDR family NAD(P)-dependent oxidoreductase [Phycisphaerae bacterium]
MRSAIAIVGMACRYPDARSPQELWENALAQRRAFRRMPDERMCRDDYYSPDPAAPDRTYGSQAAVIEGYEFDRIRFRVVGSTYRSADPAHWLALDIADAALTDAGCTDGEGLPRETTGVLLGNTLTGEFSRAGVMRLRWPYVRRVVEAALAAEGWASDHRHRFLKDLERSYKKPFPPTGEESLAGGLSNTIAGRICNQFDFKGGGYTVDGACASSLLAVINACNSLVNGDLDVALAGGVDLSLDPFELVGFAKTSALAPEKMRVYDVRSAGFWPGEGCGFVVLMREEDAIAQHRHVYATIRGWGVSSDGSGGITRPEEKGQLLALKRAYDRAGFGVDTVAYFEGHGTGTEVGDATELRVLCRALREAGVGSSGVVEAARVEARGSSVAAIGSIKANIGHTKAAAGVAGLIKATMALRYQVLPPTTGCERPHPELSGEPPVLRILDKGESWSVDGALRAGVSAMGFGGINTHLVLEGAPAQVSVEAARAEARGSSRRAALDPRTRSLLTSAQDAELFLLGAKNAAGLKEMVERLSAVAPRISQAELADLAASLAARGERETSSSETPFLTTRPTGETPVPQSCHGLPAPSDSRTAEVEAARAEGRGSSGGSVVQRSTRWRASIVASSPEELTSRLETLATWLAEGRTAHIDTRLGISLAQATGKARIGFLFPGQGSPSHLSGGAIRRRFDFVDELYAKAALPAGVDDVATEVAQPAIITASIAALDVLDGLGIAAEVAVGHSLGELAALYWGGALDRDALLRVAKARGKVMAELSSPDGSMAGLRAGRDEVEQLVDGETVVIAGLNSPRQTVISGESKAVAAVMGRAKAKGVRAVRLSASHAFHSSLVKAATPALREHLAREAFRPVARTVASTVTGSRLAGDEDLAAILCQQVTSPVRFMEAVTAVADDVDLWIEVGPGEVLRGLVADFVDKPVVALDAGGPSLGGLLGAVGAAYVIGAPVKHAALFEGRYVKPFDLDHRPRFFVNPCERAPASKSGWRYEDDEAARDERAARPTGVAEVALGATPLEVVRQLVADRAELPVSAIRNNNRLLDDLHLNSIAVGQLVAESARRLGLAPPVAPTDYADATVAGVARALEELKRTGGAAAAVEERRAPPGVDAWIRPLTVELVKQALPGGHQAPPAETAVAHERTAVSHDRAAAPQEMATVAQDGADAPREGAAGWRVFAPPGHPLKERIQAAFGWRATGGGVVVCLPPEPNETHVGLLLEAARAVTVASEVGSAGSAGPRFVLVQHGGGGAAFARTLHQERPDITTCVVDVPVDHARATEWILVEAMAAVDYSEAWYDASGQRRVPRLRLLDHAEAQRRRGADVQRCTGAEAQRRKGAEAQRVLESSNPPHVDGRAGPRPWLVGREDVMLVTGGGKGIAAECALTLAQESGVRLALLGRSRPEEDAELSANLERMAAAGTEFRYFSADVTSAADVRAAAGRAEAELGPITAFLHGAGTNVPQLLTSLDEAAFHETLNPKLRGARNVLAAVDPDRLRLFVAFGSIIARTGMPGEAHYAVANDWLAELADRWGKEHPHCRCLTLEWSVWSGVGMGHRLGRVDALAQQGVTPIPTEEGIRQLRLLLGRLSADEAGETPSRVVIAGRFGEPPTLRMEERDLPLLRFVERSRAHYPGVELVLDVELTAEADPYLDDHVFAGAKLLPAVMGLEAMAQAAMGLMGSATPPTFENVKFNRPVVVPDNGTETIRIAVLLRVSGRVDVVLRCRKTGFQVDHFSATCIWKDEGGRMKDEDAEDSSSVHPSSFILHPCGVPPVDVDPERDLYGGILFQAGRFRRLRGYRRLMATECVAEIGPGEGVNWFGRYLPGQLVLGDPGARDAAIHAIQPCIPHARILPVGVDRIVQTHRCQPGFVQTSGPRLSFARERSRDGDVFVYDVDVTRMDGAVCERWEGLRLQIVGGTGPQAPWIEPLLGPYVERRIGELVPGAHVTVVVERGTASERRERSDLAIQRALGPGATGPIRRRPDGKPDVAADGRAVSAAHAGDLTLAVAGPEPIGCDVEPVTARSGEAWRDLLGPERFALAEVIAKETSDDRDRAATRVWAACECLKKASVTLDAPLVLASSQRDDWVILSSGSLVVATFVAPVRGTEGLLVLAVLTRNSDARV